MKRKRVLWVSTSMNTRGGVASFVRAMSETSLWQSWDIRHIATHRDGSTASKIATYAVAVVAFLYEIVVRRPSVVHAHMASGGSFVRKSVLVWLSRIFRIPVVLHIHGAEFHEFYGRSPHLLQRYIEATLETAAVVVALGPTWAQRLQQIAPQASVDAIPNAVRPNTQVAQPFSGEPVRVLFLGQVGERKGTFQLLDAWAKMLADAEGAVRAQLTIAGDGEVERARAQVAELGIDSTVDVLGWIAPDEVPGLLRRSQVLALPSRNEGQPMAILEAMANGLCVVSSASGGIPDLIDDRSGILLPVDDLDGLVRALDHVVRDDDYRVRLGSNALQRIREEFDADVVSNRFDAIYRQLAGASAAIGKDI